MVDGVTIRPARDAELRACRMLLGGMFGAEHAPDVLVAVHQDGTAGSRIAGAVGLGTVLLPHGRGFLTEVAVIPPLRRRRIGRALLDAAAERVRGRAPALRALRPVEAGGGVALFLARCGFDQHETIRHFETDTAAFHADMRARRLRLEARGRVPAGARVVRLRDAPAGEVAALVAGNFGVPWRDTLRRLDPASADRFDLERSVVLMLDGVVRGVVIGFWNDGLPVIDVWVLDPAARGGWASVLLFERVTGHGLEGGAGRFRFFADDTVLDTMRVARRAGAAEIKTELHMWRRLG